MIKTQTDGQNAYNFKVQTKDGDVLLTSISFKDRQAMESSITKIKGTSLTRNHFERRTSTRGQFHFSLKDDTGNVIGHSEAYDSEAGMENGIKNLTTIIESAQ